MEAVIKKVWNYRGKLNAQSLGEVHIYVYTRGVKKYISTKVFVSEAQWDNNAKRINRKNKNHVRLNHIIDAKVTELERLQLDLMEKGEALTPARVAQYAGGGDKAAHDLIEFLTKEIAGDVTVAEGTTRYRKQMLAKLKETIGESYPMAKTDYQTIEDFNKYMIQYGYNLSTIKRNHSQLKKWLTVAVKKRYLKENPYMLYKVKKPPQKLRKTLWGDDTDRIWELTYPDDSVYELVRLKFLLSCYTGLRISDNTSLSWEDIRGDKIMATQTKTGQPVVVPLNLFSDRPQQIIEKAKKIYNDPVYVFKKISDQVCNQSLKRVGIDARAPFSLNFHIARHTFCTMVAHRTGSVFKVMEFAGIMNIETAQVYINLSKMFGQD